MLINLTHSNWRMTLLLCNTCFKVRKEHAFFIGVRFFFLETEMFKNLYIIVILKKLVYYLQANVDVPNLFVFHVRKLTL
jgi:hypothetical protein